MNSSTPKNSSPTTEPSIYETVAEMIAEAQLCTCGEAGHCPKCTFDNDAVAEIIEHELNEQEKLVAFAIISELHKAIIYLGGDNTIQSLTGSYRDTLDDDEVLDLLEQWNNAHMFNEQPTSQRQAIDAVMIAGNKMVLVFPETMPEEPTHFDIPAYIVNELRDALAVLNGEENA